MARRRSEEFRTEPPVISAPCTDLSRQKLNSDTRARKSLYPSFSAKLTHVLKQPARKPEVIEHIAALIGPMIDKLTPSRNQEELCPIGQVVRPDFVADDG